MKKIQLTNSQFAFVDDEDFPSLSKYRWHKCRDYAARNMRPAEAGYRRSRLMSMHRQIMGAGLGQQVDHISHNGLDNRRSNLRFATIQQNAFNRRGKSGSTSKYVGVSWCNCTKKWGVSICVNQKRKFLGRYDDERKAAKIRDDASRVAFGEYAYLNFP